MIHIIKGRITVIPPSVANLLLLVSIVKGRCSLGVADFAVCAK